MAQANRWLSAPGSGARLARLAGSEARAQRNLVRALAVSSEPATVCERLEGVSDHPNLDEQSWRRVLGSSASTKALVALCAESALYSSWLVEHLDALGDVQELGVVRNLQDLTRRCATNPSLQAFKREELIAIGYRDVVLGQPFPQTARQLSDVAQTIVAEALQRSRKRLDLAVTNLRFAVIALGKLGGRELNFSSDIDLMFCHDGEQAGAGEAAVTLARELNRCLDGGVEGAVYPVDLRLRPEGSSGALSVSLRAAVRYYESRGRTWERQMLLKGRVVAGDHGFGASFLAALRPFVHHGHMGMAAIDDVKELKRTLEKRSELDIKRGRGGIRDVEFSVQFLQLLHGGELDYVRTPSTLEALARLSKTGCLDPLWATKGHSAYLLLRMVEHRLMTAHGRRVHELPVDRAALTRLAGRCGFLGSVSRFERCLHEQRGSATELLDQCLHGLFVGTTLGAGEVSELVLDPDPSSSRIQIVLGTYGFSDPEGAWRELDRLRSARGAYRVQSPRAKRTLASLAPHLLAAFASRGAPDAALSRFERLVAILGAKGTFFQLLHDNPDALTLFSRLATDSPYLCNLLRRFPHLADEVVDRLLTGQRVCRDDIAQRLADCEEQAASAIGQTYTSNLLLTGLRDIGGSANLRNTMAELSVMAEAILGVLTVVALAQTAQRWGPLPPGVWVSLLAMGRLGGGEPGYGSDLDVVLCYGGDIPEGQEHLVAGGCERVAVTLLRLARDAGVYEFDMRLRPGGTAGPRACSERAFVEHHKRAEVWQRLAATRLRAVAGDLERGQALVGRVQKLLYAQAPDDLAYQTQEMRKRLALAAAGPRDLKRGPGSLVDVEFVVAFLRLRCQGQPVAVRDPSTLQALAALEQARALSPVAFIDLLTGYQLLMQVEMRLRLASGRPETQLPRKAGDLRRLALQMGYMDTARKQAQDMLLQELAHVRGRIEDHFAAIVTGDPLEK